MNLRGKKLDSVLDELLAKMLSEGYNTSPITRSSVQRKLGLKSRSTLLLNGRSELIEKYRTLQLETENIDTDGKRRRKNTEDRIRSLNSQVKRLEKDRDLMNEKLASIVMYLTEKGLDVEEALTSLRPSLR